MSLATILFAEAIRFNVQVVSVDANPGTMNVRTFLYCSVTACLSMGPAWGNRPECAAYAPVEVGTRVGARTLSAHQDSLDHGEL